MQAKHLPLLFVASLVAQVLLFDHVGQYYRYATYPYLLALLLLPSRYSPSRAMLLAFALGMAIDLFSSTLGLHAAACILVAFARRSVIYTMRSRFSHTDTSLPSLQNMGLQWTIQYTLIICLLHHAALYILASLPHPQWIVIIRQVLVSALITTAIMTVVQYLFRGSVRER